MLAGDPEGLCHNGSWEPASEGSHCVGVDWTQPRSPAGILGSSPGALDTKGGLLERDAILIGGEHTKQRQMAESLSPAPFYPLAKCSSPFSLTTAKPRAGKLPP